MNLNEFKQLFDRLLLAVYPVGSVYMSLSGDHPSDLFGGVWTKLENRFLLGSGDAYDVGTVGGSKNVTLLSNQLPSHDHRVHVKGKPLNTFITENSDDEPQDGVSSVCFLQGKEWFKTQTTGHLVSTDDKRIIADDYNLEGTDDRGKAHENMPPYIVVHMWQRVG